jgi:hypothetical protein
LLQANFGGRKPWKALQNDDEAKIKGMQEEQSESELTVETHLEPSELAKPHETETQVVLQGPVSPLEMIFNSVCRCAYSKQAKVEWNSVNSVSLDQDPWNSSNTHRMIVAASVGVEHCTGKLVARYTVKKMFLAT